MVDALLIKSFSVVFAWLKIHPLLSPVCGVLASFSTNSEIMDMLMITEMRSFSDAGVCFLTPFSVLPDKLAGGKG